jgi:protein-tyrosine phosphatase
MIIDPNSDFSPLPIANHFLILSSRPGFHTFFHGKTLRAYDTFVKQMNGMDVGFVVVLMTDAEMQKAYGMSLCDFYLKNDLKCHHFPIEDWSIPTDKKAFHALMGTMLNDLQKVNGLVHCWGGIGRTGTVAAGLLIRMGKTYEEALWSVRKIREGAVATQEQEEFLRKYALRRGLRE